MRPVSMGPRSMSPSSMSPSSMSPSSMSTASTRSVLPSLGYAAVLRAYESSYELRAARSMSAGRSCTGSMGTSRRPTCWLSINPRCVSASSILAA
jgi:hypothetical protein